MLLLRLVQAFVVNIEKVEYFKDASTGQALALSCIYLTNKLINVALNAEIAYMASQSHLPYQRHPMLPKAPYVRWL